MSDRPITVPLPTASPFEMAFAGLQVAAAGWVFICWTTHGFLDATSLATLLPSFVLCGLIVAVAVRRKLFLWQGVASSSRPAAIISQIAIYVFSPIVAYCALNQWSAVFVHYQVPDQVLFSCLACVGCSFVALSGIEYCLYRLFLNAERRQTSPIAGAFFNSFMISWLLVLMLPVIEFSVFRESVTDFYGDADIIREVARCFIAISVIPASCASITVALAGFSRPWLILRCVILVLCVPALILSVMGILCPSTMYMARALVHNGTGNYLAMIDDCTSALAFEPNAPNVHGVRAYAESLCGRWYDAVDDYSAVLNPSGEQPVHFLYYAHLGRAAAYAHLGQSLKSVADLAAARRLHHENKPDITQSEIQIAGQ
ncbi:MAG TPA: hypothetical protein V6C81_13480 [Planktothrix sp.]